MFVYRIMEEVLRRLIDQVYDKSWVRYGFGNNGVGEFMCARYPGTIDFAVGKVEHLHIRITKRIVFARRAICLDDHPFIYGL